MPGRSFVTTHVLDSSSGAPAQGVSVVLANARQEIAQGVTDSNGRIESLGPDALDPGRYRLTFDTGRYYADRDVHTFYPAVEIVFETAPDASHYHVPLLLSPFAFTTYRGS
ncbi:hydroxyisourate hydrolase [Rhodococcus sp. 14-2470-1b]|uniref:hydroxyisourate hydrolase n=1 Tax=Rhodococcus sp. 14-2470-1b TaxID=2023149 RepID=UPI000B9B4244|nr:hydroxyisourate hydrolase [Rhodococcus sp. 14-2470-1b]OZF46354.1 hydroxyisourate hydrolase [Rhodococcus sp. 14-2470-1b]